jgi:uncharacterized protein (DUF305 family)
VVFTKADLIAGFSEFFASSERSERERQTWGATMPYKRKMASQQIMGFFDSSFDELCAGLKDLKRGEYEPAAARTDGARRIHLSAEICHHQGAVAGVSGYAVRGKSLPVQACVSRLLLHQCIAGRR